jgi:hypothetical protein
MNWRRERSLVSVTADRSLIARLAAHESWVNTADPSARTAPARRAMLDRFERPVDPQRVLSPAERARRAGHARRAYFARLALRSAQARRKTPALEPERPREPAGRGPAAVDGSSPEKKLREVTRNAPTVVRRDVHDLASTQGRRWSPPPPLQKTAPG